MRNNESYAPIPVKPNLGRTINSWQEHTNICDFSSKNFFILSAEMAKQMGIYRPRSPKNVAFYQCIADHFEEFVQAYDERYEHRVWILETRYLEKLYKNIWNVATLPMDLPGSDVTSVVENYFWH